MSLVIRTKLQRPGSGGFELDVDLDLPDRGITALFGPSGCGKSTLLRCVAGLEKEAAGRITIGPHTWQDQSTFTPCHQRAAGLVFQDGALFSHLSVRGNLEYGMKRATRSDRTAGFDEVIDLLGLNELLDRHTDDLSGGERQRVALGRALLTGPDLLLLDEPLASLDRGARRAIYPYLEMLHTEIALPVLYVTHSLDEAARLADHLLLMENGRVTAAGPLPELMTDLDGTLSRTLEAGAVLSAVVAGHESEYHLTRLEFDGGQILVPDPDLELGQAVRLRILARDVSLALEPATGTSILNILPTRVTGVAARRPGRVMVRLEVGDTALLAAVTERSAAALDLKPGREVFAQIKSIALL
jgi:molybdate transport system ATP-binding protein